MGYRLKRSLALLMAVLMPLLSVSCSKQVLPAEGAGTAANSQTVITFLSNWGGSSSYRDLVEKTISDFMKANPDIFVQNESLSSEDYLSKLKTNFVSGYIPDIFYLWPGYDITALVSSGQVANLIETLRYDSDWESSFSTSALENNRVLMGIYGIPFETCFTGLYVNKRIFADNKIPIPKTYEELKEAIIRLNNIGVTPMAYSAQMDGSLLFQTIIISLSDRSTSLQYPAFQTTDPGYIEAMNVMKELYKMNAFPNDSFTLDGYDQKKLFLSGKAAMVVEGSWFTGYIDQMTDPVEIVPFPNPNPTDDQVYNLICVNGYGSFHVSSKAFADLKVRDACIRFLKYLTSPDVAASFISEKGMISALNLEDSAYKSNHYAEEGLGIIKKAKDYYRMPSELFGEDIFTEVFTDRFPYMLEDRVTPEDLYDQGQRRILGR